MLYKLCDDRDSICHDCATQMGYEPKDKVVGTWMDRCDFCGERRPLTSLSHDWHRKGENDGK